MTRRDLMKFAGIAGLGMMLPRLQAKAQANEIIKPKRLSEGDTVSLISPGSAVPSPDDIRSATEAVEALGLKAKFAANTTAGTGYRTKPRKARIDDIHEAFSDSETTGIICIRGGYGSGMLLDGLDYDLIRQNPKVFIGYSDITALHLAIHQNAGLVTFHGPVALSAFTDFTARHFKKMLFENKAAGLLQNPGGNVGIREANPTRGITPGTVQGNLTGGNLSLISSLLGTDYEIDTKDKILFLEDVGEAPYRIDRMLNQLRLAGKLDDAAGIVFGVCSGCETGDTASTWDSSLGEVLDNYLRGSGTPAFYGLLIGHTSHQLTLPYGIKAVLDADNGALIIREAAVV